jgi:RNA polymerase sigma factor for flagellar operon FliA
MLSVEAPADSPEVVERFKSGLSLVEGIARKLRTSLGSGVELDDLVSYGQEGLLTAARRFDPEQGVPFRAYASFRVRGAMIDGLRKASELPRRVRERLRLMDAAAGASEAAAQDVLGPAPAQQSRADAQRQLDEHLARMATAMAVGLIGETALGEDGTTTNVEPGRNPEQWVELNELSRLLHEQIAELPKQECELVRRHYFEGERFDLVARDLGLSKSWASRLHTRALGRLTKRLSNQA